MPDETTDVIEIHHMEYLAWDEWKEPKGAQTYSKVGEGDGPQKDSFEERSKKKDEKSESSWVHKYQGRGEFQQWLLTSVMTEISNCVLTEYLTLIRRLEGH